MGHHSLDGRSAYQPLTKQNPIDGEWYTYVGEHAGEAVNSLTGELEPNGTSILNVTDPSEPELVKHIPATGPDQSQAQMVRICNGADLPSGDPDKVYLLRSNGNVSHEIWDVTDPSSATLVTRRSAASTAPTRAGGIARAASATWSAAPRAGAPSG